MLISFAYVQIDLYLFPRINSSILEFKFTFGIKNELICAPFVDYSSADLSTPLYFFHFSQFFLQLLFLFQFICLLPLDLCRFINYTFIYLNI